jgi:hypothetical protein
LLVAVQKLIAVCSEAQKPAMGGTVRVGRFCNGAASKSCDGRKVVGCSDAGPV